MASIMQGTTPSLFLSFSESELLLSEVAALELYVKNNGRVTTYTLDDVEVDATENEIIKTFTEAETASFNPKQMVIVQGRIWFHDGSIVGIDKLLFTVEDMMGVGIDG